MLDLFFRLVCVYAVTVSALRLMGKRQIGELQTGELVVTLYLSETAVSAVTDTSFPFIYCILPPLLLICMEVIFSFGATKIRFFKTLFDIPPGTLIRRGRIEIKELTKNRLTVEELMSQLRLSGYFDLSEIDYCILEPNGKLSVKTFARFENAKASDLGLEPEERGLPRAVITDGSVNYNALRELGKDINWLRKAAENRSVERLEDVFLLTADEKDILYIILKENKNQ